MNRTRTAALLLALAAVPAGAVNVELLDRIPPRLASETAHGASRPLALSSDGRYTVIASDAADLVPGMAAEPFGAYLFLYDRGTGTMTRISRRPASTDVSSSPPQVAISADGRFVAFTSPANDEVEGQLNANEQGPDIFLWDRVTGETELVSHSHANPLRTGDFYSTEPVISADGRFVAFTSNATDLLRPEDDLQHGINVYLWDRQTGRVALVSHAAGQPGRRADNESRQPSISADGRFVTFVSLASNLVAGQVERGRQATVDAFLWDRATRQTVLVSRAAGSPVVTANRSSTSALVSADGRFVALLSFATDLLPGRRGGGANVFLWERATGAMTLVSHGRRGDSPALSGAAYLSAISANGSHVLFSSNARNLLPETPGGLFVNVFLWSRATGKHILLSRSPEGRPGNGDSFATGLSDDGAWAVFYSNATNLVAGDGNERLDAFLANGRSGRVTLLSVSGETGEVADGETLSPWISADGRWIAFANSAPGLVAGVRDLNSRIDTVLTDRSGNRTIVSVHPPGLASVTPLGSTTVSSIDASGRFVVVASDVDASLLLPGVSEGNRFGQDLFLYDRELRTWTLVTRSAANPASTAAGGYSQGRISADGRWVVFVSNATDLVAGQTGPPGQQVFLWDRTTGGTILVSRANGSPTTGGNQPSDFPRISADGSVVAFSSSASDLIPGQADTGNHSDVFLFDRTAGTITLASRATGTETVPADGNSFWPDLSDDGRVVAFVSVATDLVAGVTDTNTNNDVFLFDRTTGTATLASRTTDPAPTAGTGELPVLSGNGRFLAFQSLSSRLVPGQSDRLSTFDLFLFDRIAGTTVLITHEAGSLTTAAAAGPSEVDLSADGRFVAFASRAENLVPGQVDAETRRKSIDIFVFDRETGAIEMVTRAAGTVATAGPGESSTPVISADGRRVAFLSSRLNLLPGLHGPQTALNLFVHDRPSGTTTLVSHPFGDPARLTARRSLLPALNANGSVVAFGSLAPDLVLRDLNGYPDAFAAVIP